MCCTSETQTIAKGIARLVQYEGFKAEIDKYSLKYLQISPDKRHGRAYFKAIVANQNRYTAFGP